MKATEVNWQPQERHLQLAGAVRGKQGLKLDWATYKELLGQRIQLMLDKDENPEAALEFLLDEMERNELALPAEELDVKEAGAELAQWLDPVLPNPVLPKTLKKNDPKAEELINHLGLEGWVTNLFFQAPNPDR